MFVKNVIPLASNVIMPFRGRPLTASQLQLNDHRLERVFKAVRGAGAFNCHPEFIEHDGEWGLAVHFQEPRRDAR